MPMPTAEQCAVADRYHAVVLEMLRSRALHDGESGTLDDGTTWTVSKHAPHLCIGFCGPLIFGGGMVFGFF